MAIDAVDEARELDDAILNLRLKSLSKLEEIEIRAEHDKLSKERRELTHLGGEPRGLGVHQLRRLGVPCRRQLAKLSNTLAAPPLERARLADRIELAQLEVHRRPRLDARPGRIHFRRKAAIAIGILVGELEEVAPRLHAEVEQPRGVGLRGGEVTEGLERVRDLLAVVVPELVDLGGDRDGRRNSRGRRRR